MYSVNKIYIFQGRFGYVDAIAHSNFNWISSFEEKALILRFSP
jgi:hypothetical protein